MSSKPKLIYKNREEVFKLKLIQSTKIKHKQIEFITKLYQTFKKLKSHLIQLQDKIWDR